MSLIRRFEAILSEVGLQVVVFSDSNNSVNHDLVGIRFPTRPGWFRHLLFQIRIALVIEHNAARWEGVWFLVGGTVMLVPLLAARLIGMMTFLVLAGSPAEASYLIRGTKSAQTVMFAVLERLTIAFSTHVLAYGESGRQLRMARRIRRNVITQAHEFVDLSHFAPATPFASRPNTLGFVGRLSAEKGVLRLLDATRLLMPEFPSLKVQIVGEGPLRSEIEREIMDAKLADNVTLIGWKTRAEMPSVYGRLRLLVIPSYTEGLPNVLLEAMACETLVLATSVGAIPGIIRDGYNGFLVESNDPRKMASAISSIMRRHPNQLEEIVRRAKHEVTTSFDFESVVNKYRGICHATRLLGGDR